MNIHSFTRSHDIKYIKISFGYTMFQILQASSIAVFGFILYIISGVVLLVNLAEMKKVPMAISSKCENMSMARGGISIVLSIIYFIDAIFCFIALCVRKK